MRRGWEHLPVCCGGKGQKGHFAHYLPYTCKRLFSPYTVDSLSFVPFVP